MSELLGRDGETKADMLDWFRRLGFWQSPEDRVFLVLRQMSALQLDLLAGAVTAYGKRQVAAALKDAPKL